MKSLHKGIFICFEGLDGSGKSTQARLVYDFLKDLGEDVVLTHEPMDTGISGQIRDILKDVKNTNMANLTESFLYNAARAQHIYEVIRPVLDRGAIVICDRFNLSSFAYQGYGRGVSLKLLKKLDKLATNGLKPDVTFFMNLAPKETFIRKAKMELDRIELSGLDFYNRVYEGFLELLKKDKTIIALDASANVEKIQAEIVNYLTKLNVIDEEKGQSGIK